MGQEEDKNDIRVEDRRFFDKNGNPIREEGTNETRPTRGEKSSTPPPKMDFDSFLFMYVQTALVHLGELEYPVEGKAEENLQAAAQIIDTLDMLKEKTRGNLTQQEDQYFETVLFDLRMRFVEKAKKTR